MKLFELLGIITVNNEDANKKIGDTTKQTTELHGKIKEGMETVGEWALKFTAAAAATALGVTAALKKIVTDTMEFGTTIDKGSQRLGMTRKAYQEWNYVLGQCGMNMDQMESGMMALTNRMKEAADPNSEAAKAFQKLGVAVTDNEGNLRDVGVVFDEVVAKMTLMENQGEKLAAADLLFAGSGQLMLPMLNKTYEDIVALKEEAHELNLIMSDEDVDSAIAFSETMNTFNSVLSSLARDVGSTIIPYLTEFFTLLINNAPKIKSLLDASMPYIEGAFTSLLSALEWMISDPENIKRSLEIVGEGLVLLLAKAHPYATALVAAVEAIRWMHDTIPKTLEEHGDEVDEPYQNLVVTEEETEAQEKAKQELQEKKKHEQQVAEEALQMFEEGAALEDLKTHFINDLAEAKRKGELPSKNEQDFLAMLQTYRDNYGMTKDEHTAMITWWQTFKDEEYSPYIKSHAIANSKTTGAAMNPDDVYALIDVDKTQRSKLFGMGGIWTEGNKALGPDWSKYEDEFDALMDGADSHYPDWSKYRTYLNFLMGYDYPELGQPDADEEPPIETMPRTTVAPVEIPEQTALEQLMVRTPVLPIHQQVGLPAGNSNVVQRNDLDPLTTILQNLSGKLDTVINLQSKGQTVVLNTGALVGGIGGAMDKHMGNIVAQKARGTA